MGYTETSARVTNSDGDSVTVPGPTVADWAELTSDWKRTYRPIALEQATSEGLIVYQQGMRVVWSRGPAFE